MATSTVSDWDEIEADPDFSSLPREHQAKLFDDWEKKFNRTLLEGADLDKVKPEGLNRFAATNAIRRRKLAGEDVSDPNVAAKEWSTQKQEEAKQAQQILKDYADVEDKQSRVRDAESSRAASLGGFGVPNILLPAEIDTPVREAQQNLEAAEAKFTPEVRAQAQAASEALKGKRKIATLNGNIYTDPALVLDKDEFRQQVLDSDAPPEAKALKLASFQNEKKRYLDEAINTLTKSDPQIPLADSFPKFLESKGFDLDREMAQHSEGKLDYSPIQKQRELAQEYLTKMQDRGWFRKIGSAISTGVASGMLDIGTQAVGTAAMLTGDEEKAKVAAELSRASGDIGAAQGLEGDMQATGGTFAGGVTRLGTNMAPMLIPGGAVGGIARLAGAGAGAATAAAVGASALTAGAQTAGSQFGEVYDHLRQQGRTHEQAFDVSRNAAVLSGAVTTALTALGGATGVESLLRQGGKELVKSRLVAALKAVPGGAAAEIAEELPDEYISQLISAFAKDPNTSPSQVTDEFAANAPDLILQIAALGGAGSGVGRFKETTADPAKATQEAEFPTAGEPPPLKPQDYENRAAGGQPIFNETGDVIGVAPPNATPEETAAYREDIRKAAEAALQRREVKVNGVTIATIPEGSDMTPEDVLDFANSPEDMAMLARNGKIVLPEVVAPIDGVDPAITDEMNERLAASAAIAPQTVEALKAAPAPEVQTETAEPDRRNEAEAAEAPVTETLEEVKPAESLGVTPPPAPTLEAPEGAARNADMPRQAAARAAGTEQGPRIGFIQSPSTAVTAETETPSSTANAAGGSQSVQTEPAEGSIPTVTEDTVSISDIPSTAEIPVTPQGEEPTTATEGQPMPGGSGEWSFTVGQPATATINGQKVVGTVGPSTGKGLVGFQYEWNGRPQKATVRPDRLESPVASLTDPPKYQYTQEQNTRKMGKHFPVALGVHANHDFRKSLASMAEDTSLSETYRQMAKVLSTMPAFANVDFHVIADGRKNYAGEYSFFDGKAAILVNLRQVGRGKVDALGTILHEALHHVTLAKVLNPQGAFEIEVVGKLDKIRERVAEYAKQQGISEKAIGYETDTLEEFISALTRPDFQRFLASIPDSFAPGVAVGKYRSVLSEVFRHIAELLFKKPVPKGSTLEQYTTTILALFETPHRTIPLKPLSYLRAQSKPGYRTPADMLAEAAEKVKGERAAEKPQGLASMFKPQAKRPATGERKLLEMPVRNTIADAYREAVRGGSTQMAPLSSVYAQARLLQPGLTPEAFLAQVQEGYDNGTLLLEGAGSQQEAKQAGLALPGTPVGTAVRMMPAPETPKSLVDEETDAAYMAAVEAGDMETAQRMVDEAAKAAGYRFKLFRGDNADFSVFSPYKRSENFTSAIGFSFSDDRETAAVYGKVREFFIKGKTWTVDYLADLYGKTPESAEDWQKSYDEEVLAEFIGADQVDTNDDDSIGEFWRKKRADIVRVKNIADNDLTGGGDRLATLYIVKSPNQIKSADPVTRDADGNVIPLSQRFNPESNSILYAAPIDISTLPTREPASGENVPDREAGSSENAETVSQRLESRRKEAISSAVAENDWGNYTREQKVAAAESFLAKWVVSFSAMEFPADVRFSVEVGDGSGAHVSVHEVPSRPLGIRVSVGQNRGLDKYANLSPTEVFAHLYDTAQEESIHVAQYLGMHRDWLEAREQGFKGTFLSYIGQKLKDTFDQINKARIDLQQTDSAAAEKIKDAMLASWNIYHFNDRVEDIAGLWSRLEGDPSRQGEFIMEMVRQLTQLKRQDFTTETGWQKFQRVLKQWITDAINSLRGVQDVFRSGMAGDLIQRQLADLEAALEGKPLPSVSRGPVASLAEEPDQRESDAILGVMMEDGRFEEGVKAYDKAKRANLGAPPQPSPNTSTPPRFTSPAQFAAAFEAAFLRGDYDYFLEALKQADRHIYVPEMKRYINASKLGDTDAAERLEWFRHAIAGTIPANVKPQASTQPAPAAVGAPTTPPPPTVTPPPKAGASNRPMLTLNTPAMGLIAKMLGASIRINTLLRRARGKIKLSMADGSEIELSKHLFKDPVQAAKTLAHEIGHLFDFLPASGFTKTLAHKLAPLGDFRKVFGNDLADWFMDGGKKIKPSKITQLIKPELVALSKKWRGDFSPSDKYRGSGKELYADFISAILNDPMWTAKNAPYATLGFLNALEQKPEVEQAYQLLVSLVQGGSLYKALAEADQGRSTNALERLIAKSSALMRAKKTLNDATRGLYRSMFGKWLPTAIRDGGIWKSYWNRLKDIGTSKDYNWAQEEASQFAVRQITRFDNDLASAVGIPLKLAGIDPDYLQRLQTNNRIIHERRRVGKLIEEDPVKARELLKWMVDAGLLGKDVQAEVDGAADGDLYALTAKVIGMMHADGDSFERALKAARRKGAPADAEKALYAFDVSGFMLNPKVLTMESAEADNADIEQTLGPDQFAELQRINDGYHDLVKRTMVDAYKLGLFRKSTWDDVIEPNFGAYVPFTPIKYFTGHVKGGLGPARVGTAHDLMAPHVVGTLKMHALIRRMQQQKQALLLLDFFNNAGLSNELEPVEDENFDRIKAEELTRQSKHTISYVPYWDDGEYKWVKVNGTDAVTLMQNSDPDDLAALYKVLRSNTQMWRLNFTIFSIAFNIANTLRNIATPFVDIGPKAGYKAAKQLLSIFPQMAKWVWARIAGKDPASVVAASLSLEHAMHKPGMPVSKELQEFYDRGILQPMPDVAALRMSQEELARNVMGAMSSPEFLLQGVHKAAKDMKWYDNTLKQYLHSAVDVMSFIGSVSEAAPKIAAYQALKERKDSKGKPAFTDAQATYLATLEGIPRPGVAGAHNAALEMVLMFFRVAVQSWRKHLVMATAPQTRAGFLMRHMLFESAKFGLQAMAANGAIDYLIALGAAAAAGGDDDDPEKFKQVDWAEAMDRQSSYKLSHGGIGPLLGWVLPDGRFEPPWGHKTIPADWVPIMPRLPGTELSREADPMAYYVTSKMLAPEIAPVNDDVFWNDFVRSIIPSLNPTFEVASDAMSVLGPTPPRDSYRGREKVEQRIWDEGYAARIMGLGEHHLKSFGVGSNPYDTPLPGVWNVLKQPGVKTLLASDNMVGVRDEQRARHEDDLTSSFAQNMVGEKFNALKKTFNRLKGKTTPKTPQEIATYEVLKPIMSKAFYGTEKRDGLYDVLQSYARMKAKGLQDTPGGKLLKAEAEQATKDLEKIADDLQKPLEFIRTHTLP